MVRTGGLTVPAADTTGINLADNAVVVIDFGGCRRTDGNAGCMMVAVHARSGEIGHLGFWKRFPVCDLIKLHPGDGTLLVRFIRPDGHIIFSGAGDHAGPAARAPVQIDNHSVFVFSLFRFHYLPRTKVL